MRVNEFLPVVLGGDCMLKVNRGFADLDTRKLLLRVGSYALTYTAWMTATYCIGGPAASVADLVGLLALAALFGSDFLATIDEANMHNVIWAFKRGGVGPQAKRFAIQHISRFVDRFGEDLSPQFFTDPEQREILQRLLNQGERVKYNHLRALGFGLPPVAVLDDRTRVIGAEFVWGGRRVAFTTPNPFA